MTDSFVTAAALLDAIGRRAVSAEEACRMAIRRIESLNPRLNAFHSTEFEHALTRARELDREPSPVGPLHGVPVALKDNIATSVGTTTAGSKMLEHYRSPYDATVVRKLHAAGAVLIGKTNCD